MCEFKIVNNPLFLRPEDDVLNECTNILFPVMKETLPFNPRKSRISENNIACEVYHRCRLKGIDLYLEYKHEDCRFDGVVVKNNRILLLLEFKSRIGSSATKVNLAGRQFNKYTRFGVDLLYILRIENVDEAVEIIEEYWNSSDFL